MSDLGGGGMLKKFPYMFPKAPHLIHRSVPKYFFAVSQPRKLFTTFLATCFFSHTNMPFDSRKRGDLQVIDQRMDDRGGLLLRCTGIDKTTPKFGQPFLMSNCGLPRKFSCEIAITVCQQEGGYYMEYRINYLRTSNLSTAIWLDVEYNLDL